MLKIGINSDFKSLFSCLRKFGTDSGNLKGGQDPMQEIIAELSAAVLCRIIGKQPGDTLGNSYRYIEAYAKKLGIKPHCACMKVMGDTEKVLHLILDAGKKGVQN